MGKYDNANDVAIRLRDIYKAENRLNILQSCGIGTPEEIENLERSVSEKEDTEKQFIDMYKNIIYKLANKYAGVSELEDLYQEQFAKARSIIMNYDESKGKFITYLAANATDALMDYTSADKTFYTDKYTRICMAQYETALEDLKSKGIDNPSDEEIADCCGWNMEKYHKFQSTIKTSGGMQVVSLNSIIDGDDDSTSLESLVSLEDDGLEDVIISTMVSSEIRDTLKEILTPDQYIAITDNYGINDLAVKIKPQDTMARMGWEPSEYQAIIRKAKKEISKSQKLNDLYKS